MPQFISPVITPFNDDLTIDVPGYRQVISRALEAGLDGVLIMGSAGEFYTLRPEERDELTLAAVQEVSGHGRLMVGTGACSTRDAVAASQRAVELGATEIMVVSPYYFSLDDDTLFDHYCAIANAVPVDVLLYNFPLRTVHDLKPGLVLRLADACPNIVGIKDTVVDPGHTRAIIDKTRHLDRFETFSGFDIQFALNGLMGGAGCIAALSNIWPDLCAAWAKAVAGGDNAAINHCQRVIDVAARVYDVTAVFIGALKHAMALRGVSIGTKTRTARQLSHQQVLAIQAIIDEVESL